MALSAYTKREVFDAVEKFREQFLMLGITPEEIYNNFITPDPEIDDRFDDAESNMQQIRENREESLQTIALAMGLV